MFPLVPVQEIQVVYGEPAIGTQEGFSCVCLPNVSITPVLGYCDLVTLGAPILIFTLTLVNIGSSPCPSLLHCLLEQGPPLCDHLMSGSYSTNSWNTYKIYLFTSFRPFQHTYIHTYMPTLNIIYIISTLSTYVHT